MKRGLLLALVAAALWCALVVAVHRDSPRTRLSAHGLLHVAIAEQCRARDDGVGVAGGVGWLTPPENPLHAGTKLPYYYFFHDFVSDLALATRTSLATAFEVVIVASVAVVVLVGWALGRRLFRSDAAGLALSFLFFAGAHPQGPLVLLARWLRHRGDLFTSHGFAADGDYLWGLVHPVDGAMRLGDAWSTLGPLVAYFLNLTARPLALAALLVAVAWLARSLERASFWNLAGVALASWLCTLFNPITGVAAAGALSFALFVTLRRDAARLAIALVVGVLASLPWWSHLLGRGDAAGALKFSAQRLLGVVSGAWLLAFFAASGALRLAGRQRSFALALFVAAAALCVPTVLLELPVGNEDNFFHVALALLAVPACGVVVPPSELQSSSLARAPAATTPAARRPGRWIDAAICCGLFAPTLAIVLFSYVRRPPLPIAFTHDGLERTPSTSREAQLYAWLRASTPPDAVIAQDPGPEGRKCTGNTSELPAFTARCLFADYANHYLVEPYGDAKERVDVEQRLARGERLDTTATRRLADLRRPVFLVTYDAPEPVVSSLREQFGAPRFEFDGVRVHAWKESP